MPSMKGKASLGRLAAARRRDLFFVLGEPTRRRLIDLIARGEQQLGWLTKSFTSSRQAISDHLLVLRQAGLVATRLEGNRRYYRLRTRRLREMRSWLAYYEQLCRREGKTVSAQARPPEPLKRAQTSADSRFS